MTERTTLAPVIRRAGEGEKRWFFGGGVFTWKLSSANEDIGLWEVDMVEGKWTPIHTHPVSESMWVLDGQIQYRINDDEHELGAGDFVMVPAGVPHAFIVKSRNGQGARHPADLRVRTLLPRRQRALRGIGVHRGLRPDRAERPGERRHRDRWTPTVLEKGAPICRCPRAHADERGANHLESGRTMTTPLVRHWPVLTDSGAWIGWTCCGPNADDGPRRTASALRAAGAAHPGPIGRIVLDTGLEGRGPIRSADRVADAALVMPRTRRRRSRGWCGITSPAAPLAGSSPAPAAI